MADEVSLLHKTQPCNASHTGIGSELDLIGEEPMQVNRVLSVSILKGTKLPRSGATLELHPALLPDPVVLCLMDIGSCCQIWSSIINIYLWLC